MYFQSFMGHRIQHHTDWEDEVLMTGLLGLHFSPWVSRAASFISWLRDQEDEPSQKPLSQWHTEGTAITLEDI